MICGNQSIHILWLQKLVGLSILHEKCRTLFLQKFKCQTWFLWFAYYIFWEINLPILILLSVVMKFMLNLSVHVTNIFFIFLEKTHNGDANSSLWWLIYARKWDIYANKEAESWTTRRGAESPIINFRTGEIVPMTKPAIWIRNSKIQSLMTNQE